MLRASSLGLTFSIPTSNGFQRCFLHKTDCTFPPTRCMAPQPFRPASFVYGNVEQLLGDSTTSDGTVNTLDKLERKEGQTAQGSPPHKFPQTQHVNFRLPPMSPQSKPCLSFGFQNRRSFRAKGVLLPEGFERITHLSSRKRPKILGPSINPMTTIKDIEYIRRTKHPKSMTTAHKESIERRCTTESTFHLSMPWRPLPIKQVSLPPLPTPTNDFERSQHKWLRILSVTGDASEAWTAYTALLEHPLDRQLPRRLNIPLTLLHRLLRLLARHRPKTHTWYMRMLAVSTRLRGMGGTLHLPQWNALINAAGEGLRRITIGQYEAALSFLIDMTKGRPPGTTLKLGLNPDDRDMNIECLGKRAEPVEPDIYTYTTLLNIAVKTGDMHCVRHARMLLDRSGIPSNRITHLALMKYSMVTDGPAAIRSTLLQIEQQNMELGLDGINACLLAYSYNYRHDVITMIYRLLRHNVIPEPNAQELEEIRRRLKRDEFILVPTHLHPNEVTYTTMIQIMAYHGHFTATLRVFVDMLSTLNLELGAPLIHNAHGKLGPTQYQPTVAVFRAIFLGFRRHGIELSKTGHTPATTDDEAGGWTLDNLEKIFEAFMDMPVALSIGPSVFYWLIVAFRKTSGNDKQLMRHVWVQVEKRYMGPWNSPDFRLQKLRADLFPKEGQSGNMDS